MEMGHPSILIFIILPTHPPVNRKRQEPDDQSERRKRNAGANGTPLSPLARHTVRMGLAYLPGSGSPKLSVGRGSVVQLNSPFLTSNEFLPAWRACMHTCMHVCQTRRSKKHLKETPEPKGKGLVVGGLVGVG